MIDQTPPNGFTPFIYTVSIPSAGSTSSYVWYKTVNPNCDWAVANYGYPFDTTTFSPLRMDASNDPNGYVFYVVGWQTGKLYVLDSYSTGNLGSMSYVDRTPPVTCGSGCRDSLVAADRSSSRPYTVTYTTATARPSQAFLSNDRGQTWREVTGDLATKLPDANYWKLIANPGDQSQLFLGTDQGIYRSDNGGTNWYRFMNGMPAVASINGLELNYDYSNPPLLHLGTYGRGFWDRQVGADAVLSSVTLIPTQVVGGQQQSEVVVWLDRPAPQDITVSLTSSNPSVFPVPSTITVSQGYSNAGVEVNTSPVTGLTYVTVTGTYNEVQQTAVLTVTQEPTATSLTSSPNPSTYGQTVTFTATVTSSYGTPTGTVTFYDSGTSIGTASLSGGHALLSTQTLGGGSHSITAVYAGNSTFSGSSSSPLIQHVNKESTTTSLTSSPNPSSFDQTVIFTATVTFTYGSPTGTVTFYDSGTSIGTGSVSGGHASLSIHTLSVGSHTITAAYGGDTNFNGSTSSPLVQRVNKAATTTSFTSSVNPSSYDQTVIFTATVTSSYGTPTGTVTFYDSGTSIGTGSLSGGHATLSIQTLSVGSHSITAVYGGNSDFNGSTSSPLVQRVNKAATTTSLTSSLNPSHHGQSVTFTATVTGAFGGSPRGSVSFKDGTVVIGTGTINTTTHKATFTTSSLATGTHSITAVYAGNGNFVGSTSPVLHQVVNP
jgi:hypothetical protein